MEDNLSWTLRGGVQAFQFRKHDFDLWVGGDGLDKYRNLPIYRVPRYNYNVPLCVPPISCITIEHALTSPHLPCPRFTVYFCFPPRSTVNRGITVPTTLGWFSFHARNSAHLRPRSKNGSKTRNLKQELSYLHHSICQNRIKNG